LLFESVWLLFVIFAKRKCLPSPWSTLELMRIYSYKPDLRLRFITEELGFESDADAAQFIINHNGQELLEDRTEYIAFLTGKAGPLFENARKQAFRTVDIKGQI
jgi:hypothetical protein